MTKKNKISWSGVSVGISLIFGGLYYSYYIFQHPEERTGNAYLTIVFLFAVGQFFIRKAKQGTGAKHLLTKEDIGKFTVTPGWDFTTYLLVVGGGGIVLIALLIGLKIWGYSQGFN